MAGHKDITYLFLKLGFTAFGGPAAHIAMMQQEVVHRHKWLSEQEFLDIMGAVNLIPGPNSTELALHIGYSRAGWKGMLIAGACFILPAVFITGIFAWLYKMYGAVPQVQPFIYGIKPAVIAIILAAIYPMGRSAVKSVRLAIIGLLVLALALAGINEILLLLGAGITAVLFSAYKSRPLYGFFGHGLLPLFTMATVQGINLKLFIIFLKVGAVLYGSGYALFAFLDAELVSTGLFTRPQLIDAIAVGQFTPGPVFSSVTFIGYQINGVWGAAVSTIGIFLPSFAFVALLGHILKKVQSSPLFRAFLDAVNVASVAVIIAICYAMGIESVTEWRTVAIGLAAIFFTFHYPKINSSFIVTGGSLAGYLLYWV